MLRVQSKAVFLLLAAVAVSGVPALVAAEPVADLYTAQVPAASLSGAGLDDAFALALDAVLVKVSGQRNASARRSGIGPAAALVSQYQPVPGGELRVSFDPRSLRQRLDAARLPVWADDRPRTLIILPSAPFAGMADMSGPLLQTTAAERGLPVVVRSAGDGQASADPLADPVATARAAGANLLLVGRPAPAGGAAFLRWTLAGGDERAEWQGDVTEGVHGLADRLAARYAAAPGSGRIVSLRIIGIDSFDAYGRLQSYLRSVGVIQRLELQRVAGTALEFQLDVRGDSSQLADAFALQRVLVPVAGPGAGELVYRLGSSP
jgi:hypothetical protein